MPRVKKRTVSLRKPSDNAVPTCNHHGVCRDSSLKIEQLLTPPEHSSSGDGAKLHKQWNSIWLMVTLYKRILYSVSPKQHSQQPIGAERMYGIPTVVASNPSFSSSPLICDDTPTIMHAVINRIGVTT